MKKKLRLNHIIFVAISIVAVISLVAFWGICNHKVFNMITDRVVVDYAQTTMAVQENVETLISYTEDFSKYLSVNDNIRNNMRELTQTGDARSELEIQRSWEQVCSQLIATTSRLTGLSVYSETELLYGYYNSSISYDIDVISKTALAGAKSSKEPQWTDLMTLESTVGYHYKAEPVYAVLKYVQSEDGEYLGTIALFVREASFSNILTNAKDTQNRTFFLINDNNQIVSSLDKTNLYCDAAQVLGLTQEEYRMCMAEKQLLVEPVGKASILYMASQIEGTPFRLVGRTVLEELQVQRRELAVFMQVTLFLTLFVAIVVSWLVSKQVTRPIKQIIGVMKQIEDSPNTEKLRCPVGGTEETHQLGVEFNRLMDKVDEAAEQIYQEQRQRRHNEVKLLQAQIVPHFLYNTLNMISAFIKLNRRDEAQDAIQNLATFYRKSLSGGNERITVKEEMELTRSYLNLQRMRYVEYVDYTVIQDEKAGDFIIPKLLIQPLVENVLNHGLKANGEKCLIIIETRYDEETDRCLITVCDTGRGIAADRLAQIRQSLKSESSLTKSFGLLNVYQRMKLVYGERFTMGVESVEGEFTQFLLEIHGAKKYQEVETNV